MAIANKATTQGSSGSANPSLSHTPNVAGDPRFVVVMVVELAGSDTVTGVTYDGTGMTEITNSPHTKSSGEGISISAWFLGSSVPPTTPSTVQVTAPGSIERAVFCWTYTAAEDCTVNATDVGISSDSESNPRSSIALGGVTSAVMLGFGSGLLTVGITELSGWAADMDIDGSTASGHGYSYSTIASADVTTGWDQAADDTLGFAVAVREGGGSGSSILPLLNSYYG